MNRATFEEVLRAAARRAVEFARQYVREGLPDEVTFLVYPNQSYDGNPLVGDEVVFPGDAQPGGGHLGPWPAGQTADFLWRDGKVPEWIDIAVEEVVGSRTVVSLRCCGRFTAQDDLLYHRVWGLSPFLVKSPRLPPDWTSVEASGKFFLRWQREWHRARPARITVRALKRAWACVVGSMVRRRTTPERPGGNGRDGRQFDSRE